MNKSDVVREVLTELGQDAPAANIAATVRERYGVNVSPAYVRVCRSRDAREAGVSHSPRPAKIEPTPVTVLAPRPRAPARPIPRADEVDQGDEQVFQLIDRTIEAVIKALGGKQQQVTGTPELIAEIAAVLDDDEIRRDYPGYAYDVFSDGWYKTLRLFNAELPPADPLPDHNAVRVPSDSRDFTISTRPRKSSKVRERECDFCEGKRQHVLGIDLYQVRGGPIGPRTHILCGMHAQGLATAGAEVRPYRVKLVPGYGVIEPEPIPYRKMLTDSAKSA